MVGRSTRSNSRRPPRADGSDNKDKHRQALVIPAEPVLPASSFFFYYFKAALKVYPRTSLRQELESDTASKLQR